MSRDSNIKLSVVIPAFTEALRLPHTLDESIRYLKSQAYGSEIIVVDDGSTDETGRIVQDRIPSAAVPLRLLAHPDKANHGKGAAVRRGMLETRGDYRLFMDADNSTTLEQVERFWPCFDKGYQVAIGSRALADSVIGIRQARYKELAGKFGNWIVRTFAVPEIRDTQAGFKMFTGGAADLIFPRQTIDRWGYDIEVL
ncbi:MAG TPA: glycosyltransferase, partial [Acidobacteriota bacterium]|nr:glycosyltransferase [Acidobacteriota bacterium]